MGGSVTASLPPAQVMILGLSSALSSALTMESAFPLPHPALTQNLKKKIMLNPLCAL